MTKTSFREQCAVLAHRSGKHGPKIVLVTSMETHRWVLPKGNLVVGLTARESAALEAFEEAGVEGTLGKRPIGTYDYRKTELKGGGLCRVSVFPMAVERILSHWPEQELRQREWMTLEEATKAVDEPELKALIKAFGKTLATSRTAKAKG